MTDIPPDDQYSAARRIWQGIANMFGARPAAQQPGVNASWGGPVSPDDMRAFGLGAQPPGQVVDPGPGGPVYVPPTTPTGAPLGQGPSVSSVLDPLAQQFKDIGKLEPSPGYEYLNILPIGRGPDGTWGPSIPGIIPEALHAFNRGADPRMQGAQSSDVDPRTEQAADAQSVVGMIGGGSGGPGGMTLGAGPTRRGGRALGMGARAAEEAAPSAPAPIGHNGGPPTPPAEATPAYRPIIGEGADWLNAVRNEHGAQEGALPFVGATAPVTPPPHVKTRGDFDALVQHYADLAQQGAAHREWYEDSGQSIYRHAGDNPRAADAVAFGAARTSPQTPVGMNTGFTIKGHNQALAGDPIVTGKNPNVMGEAISKHYLEGEPISGEKIGPFLAGSAEVWNPNLGHSFVNDGWNMTALGYPRENTGTMWEGTPTAGQHNFSRIVADKARAELERRTGMPWSPKQTQAATWSTIKALTEGTPLGAAGQSFADFIPKNYGQISYESAPGMTSNHFPEYHSAPYEQKVEFHNAINSVLKDEAGRDIISKELGLLTGPTVDGPGVFGGNISPGSQAQIALGTAAGGAKNGIDASSRALADTASLIRGALLRQDAAAWHKPNFVTNLKKADTNMIDVNLGRPLTEREALEVTQALKDHTGSDFFSPISTPQGFRVLNIPEYSGYPNAKLHDAVDTAMGRDTLPNAETRPVAASSGYAENNWKENPNGEGYAKAATELGRPHLLRAYHDIQSRLGPRIAQVEEDFAKRYGWTPDRSTRFWEHPDFGKNLPPVDPAKLPYWLRSAPEPGASAPPGALSSIVK